MKYLFFIIFLISCTKVNPPSKLIEFPFKEGDCIAYSDKEEWELKNNTYKVIKIGKQKVLLFRSNNNLFEWSVCDEDNKNCELSSLTYELDKFSEDEFNFLKVSCPNGN